MPEKREQRRLAAILIADVVGYSRLMAADETGTLSVLRERRKAILEPVIRDYGGRIVKVMGDGLLVEFASVVNSVQAALELQERFAQANESVPEGRRVLLRIGINIGDIVEEDSDIYGEGVNTAARLEALAEPGGICVSAKVHDEVRGKITEGFTDLGEKTLKNLAEPVRVYALVRAPAIVDQSELPLPNKPSIAVLAFDNLSDDAEQEYFADGVVEEIITALSRMRWLFVIARNSSFAYKGRAVDVKQIGRELGVRYILEGSVRRAGHRVRITGQLVDTATGAHLWAERFDGSFENIFDLQDQVTSSVVGAIAPKLEQAEIERAKRKPTENLDAYDYYLRGLSVFHQWTRESSDEALPLFYKAMELDPNFAAAYGMAARCYSRRKSAGRMTDPAFDVAEATRLAQRAASLGRDDAVALAAAGTTLSWIAGDIDEANALIDRALVLNPNLAAAWLFSGWVKIWRGEHEAAIECEMRAMRLSPQDPQIFNMQDGTAAAHFFSGRYADAYLWADMASRKQPYYVFSLSFAAASAALAGNVEGSEKAMARLRQLIPELRLSNLKDLFPLRRPEDMQRFAQGLRKAGLPE
jgi:TolB-like protein/class 3 adenylate cyclase/Tfp pilus assembly protein PilF